MSSDLSCFHIRKAALIYHRGGVIIYPTESIFGLGCNPQDFYATQKLLTLKQRPIEKGLILIAANIDQLRPYISATEKNIHTILSPQKAPTTWLVKASTYTPAWITGSHTKVAIRITKHPVIKQMCNQLAAPLVSTSANPGGKPPARSRLKSRIYFGNKVDYYVPGSLGNIKNPSQIIDLESRAIIRKN